MAFFLKQWLSIQINSGWITSIFGNNKVNYFSVICPKLSIHALLTFSSADDSATCESSFSLSLEGRASRVCFGEFDFHKSRLLQGQRLDIQRLWDVIFIFVFYISSVSHLQFCITTVALRSSSLSSPSADCSEFTILLYSFASLVKVVECIYCDFDYLQNIFYAAAKHFKTDVVLVMHSLEIYTYRAVNIIILDWLMTTAIA